jgi:L-seryl-tRNA(Ser) seleniumtransferase
MKVHTSNYAIQGFTKGVTEAELASIAHAHEVPLVTDLGSGTLIDLEDYGLPHEPTVSETLTAGADLVTFSGDKLLGGPQAGIIVGSRELISQINANPLKRALRIDKLTLAALVEVLKLYTEPERLTVELPIMRHLTRPLSEIEDQARRLTPTLERRLPDFSVIPTDLYSQIGSGALPLRKITSAGLRVTPVEMDSRNKQLEQITTRLRTLPRPVIGRVHEGSFWLNLRCLDDEQLFTEQLENLPLQEG